MINEIIILEKNVKGHLIKCKECNINFTSSTDKTCILCDARLSADKQLMKEMREILK